MARTPHILLCACAYVCCLLACLCVHVQVFDGLFWAHSSRARFLLSGRWVTRFPPTFLGRPPLDDIRDYFGEKTAFYFAFMHHYTKWLLYFGVAALLSLVLLLQDPRDACPDQWATHNASLAAFNAAIAAGASTYIDTNGKERNAFQPPIVVCAGAGADNALVPWFGVAGALWSVYFFKYWRRYQSELVYRWDVSDFEQEEPTRPEFYRHKSTRHDRTGFYDKHAGFMPFGDDYTPYFPGSARATRFGAGLGLTLLLMLIIIIGTLGIFALRLSVTHSATVAAAMGVDGGISVMGMSMTAEMLGSLIAATLNTVFIGVFNSIYRRVGVVMTDWENHRTQSAYENSLILKNSIFQSVNSYISLVYLAFIKPFAVPGFLYGLSQTTPEGATVGLVDTCSQSGCMQDLVTQMLVVVFVKQFSRNFASSVVPWLRACYKPTKLSHDELSGVEKLGHEAALPEPRSTYWEFNEMAIQYGYVTMFAAAAPWAATLCVLNNAVERKADAMSMLYGRQHPTYEGASSIGAWSTVFEMLSFAAIVTNLAIVGITSDSLTDLYGMSPTAVLWLCLVLEHVLVVLKFYVQVRMPDAPLWVVKAAAYQEWLVKRGEDDEAPRPRDVEALQAAYDEDDENERYWL